MQILSYERLGEFLQIFKTKFNVTPVMRDGCGLEQVVPQAEADPVINAIRMALRPVLGMMPNVHLRVVDYIFQGAQRDPDIAVIRMPDHQCDQVNNKELFNPKPDHRQRDILQPIVDHILHPVEPQMRGKPQLLYGMMHLVKLP